MYPLIKKIIPCLKKDEGYSLIQMAMALIVVGLLAGMFIRVYEMYNSTQKVIKTQENISIAINAIHTFRQTFGHYPCPAPMNAARTLIAAAPAPAYGRASDYDRYLPTGTNPLAIGDCAEGICIEATDRGAPLNDVRVRVGSIPFRNLQLDEDKISDAYGSRLWYAVTEDQCNLATFDDTKGGIRIVNDLGEDQTSPIGSASYAVISPGVNRVGGYGKDGQQQSPCPAATVPEAENCRDVSVATQADTTSTYRSQFVVDTTADTSFDDVVEFFSSSVNQLWRRTSTTSENIVDVANSNVGIGRSSPVATLDINQSSVNMVSGDLATLNATAANVQHGGLRVNTSTTGVAGSKIYAQTYCDEGGGHCFQTTDIMGDNTAGTGGMVCPTDTYPVGIETSGTNAQFVCVPDISIRCPSGYIFQGFTNSGGVLVPSCTNSNLYASCAATTKTLCSADDVSLSLTAHGNYSPYFYKGSCRQARFYCSNGTWSQVNTSGSCTNNVVGTPTVTACGNCWSGNFTTTTRECSGSSNDSATQCKCQASATCYTDSYGTCPSTAPSGDGGVTRRYKVCDPGNLSTPAFVDPADPGTVITPQSCSCTKKSKNVFSACSVAGYIRTSTPALPTADDAATNVWPADLNLGVAQHVAVDANCEFQNSGAPINACGCNTADRYTGELVGTPSCKKPKSGDRSFGGTSFGWSYNVMKSVVTNPATCTFSTPVLHDAAQFDDLQPYWREQPGGANDFNKPESTTSIKVDDPCNCSIYINQLTNCRKGNGTGSWDIYKCMCTGS